MNVMTLPYGAAGWEAKKKLVEDILASRRTPPFRYDDILILAPSSRMKRFYRLTKQFSKSKFYAKKLEKFFRKESKEFKKTLWGQKILEAIKDADKELKKKKGG